ncbi:MAG: S-layer homology domain-containing protein [Oscillospiraceae bacterium]|nr:S-layer homology domain-containing protein [Oscillospiraceae bacterium]
MKRVICLLIVLTIVCSVLPAAGAAEESQISPAFLHYLQAKFPSGKYWNHAPGEPNDPDGWTDKPCTHHGTGTCDFVKGSCGCNVFDGCIQCFGFAAKLAHECTGTMLHTWKKVNTLDGLKAGDVVRINNDQHSIFITSVKGDEVIFADCNIASDCQIRWNTKTTVNWLQERLTYVQTAPVSASAPNTPSTTCKANYKFGETVELFWNPLPNADEYQIRISLNGEYLRTATVTERSSYAFTPEQFGMFTFEITAKNRYGASAPAQCSTLVDPHECQIKYFTDVKNFLDWSHAGIEYAVVNGLFKGTSETTFSPDATMTRAMIATVLWRLENSPETVIDNPYSDVDNAADNWYRSAVLWAYENGIMDGVGNGRFDPDGVLTREQIVTVLYRYAGETADGAQDLAALEAYADAKDVAEWATDAVCWAIGREVIQGSRLGDAQYLTPNGSASRAQVATILMRFLKDDAAR